uniref:Sodium channel protein Nach n=1 Tax=Timema poppense TaxID=170557 RepID=A0A7R9H179_TIMPO|nr:unnamed protein product [Timema poppensis]
MSCLDRSKNYCLNSSLHGLRFIAASDSHWTERVFWLCMCAGSWYFAAKIIMSSIDNFNSNTISLVVETSYLDWNTEFPSVSVCESKNEDKLKKFINKYYDDEDTRQMFFRQKALRNIAFFKGEANDVKQCYKIVAEEQIYNEVLKCPTANISEISYKIRSTCSEMFKTCDWNGKSINCCDYFLPIETEMGICYSINNIQANLQCVPPGFGWGSVQFLGVGHSSCDVSEILFSLDSGGKRSLSHGGGNVPGRTLCPTLSRLNRIADTSREECPTLETARSPTQNPVYIHSTSDVPNLNFKESDKFEIKPKESMLVLFALKDVTNENGVKDVDISQRKCRFPAENELTVYRYYSYSGCIVQCRIEKQMRLCNCTTHFAPGNSELAFDRLSYKLCVLTALILMAYDSIDSHQYRIICIYNIAVFSHSCRRPVRPERLYFEVMSMPPVWGRSAKGSKAEPVVLDVGQTGSLGRPKLRVCWLLGDLVS